MNYLNDENFFEDLFGSDDSPSKSLFENKPEDLDGIVLKCYKKEIWNKLFPHYIVVNELPDNPDSNKIYIKTEENEQFGLYIWHDNTWHKEECDLKSLENDD